MKRARAALWAAATLFVASFSAGAISHAKADEYRGRACIFSVNQHCEAVGYKVGDCASMRFTPPNALGNGNNTRFSLFYNFYAQNFRQDGSAIGGTFQDAEFSFVGSGGGTAGESQTKWRIPLVQPADYSQAWIHMIVDLFRYDDFGPGSGSLCYTRWRAVGSKVPDPAAVAAQEGGLAAITQDEGLAAIAQEEGLAAMDGLLSGGLSNAAPGFGD